MAEYVQEIVRIFILEFWPRHSVCVCIRSECTKWIQTNADNDNYDLMTNKGNSKQFIESAW